MVRYVIRRLGYSVLIILGVVLVTFVLFRIAAGDPTGVVLGKNPSPREIEDLRVELGVDKPLFWGWWRKTEMYPAANFLENRDLPGVVVNKRCGKTNEGLRMPPDGDVSFAKNFDLDAAVVAAMVTFQGGLRVAGNEFVSTAPATRRIVLDGRPDSFRLTALNDGARLIRVTFQRRQESPWNSQMTEALGEIIRFKSTFPYVSLFNFGRTLVTREKIRSILARGIGPSLMVMTPIFLGELVLGIVLALFATANKDGLADRAVVLLSVAGMSVSYLVFIIFGQWYLGYYFNLFPVWGYGDLRHLILPVVVGIASGLGGGVRFYRTVFIHELKSEYLRTAVAKGCGPVRVYCRHLLRNAMVPILARATTIIPFLFTGSLLLESFFGIPGLGYAGVNALMNSDLQLVKALVVVGALLFVSINLLADVAYAWADPRVRFE